jgi:DeoR/GlpR family transcriptional regulator of sugar metabolism
VIPVERQQQLVELLRREPGLAVPELAARLGVSPGTVRNDLRAMAESGLVVRVRGGGTVLPEMPAFPGPNFTSRARENEAAKRAIGRKAAELVQDGDSILLDASTSVYHLAQFLNNRQRLRVVTNGIEVARLLSQNPTHMVMLVGGTLRAGTQSVTGPWSLRYLDEVCTRFAFVSCSGFTPEGGLTEVDVYEAEFRVKAIDAATQVIALIDSAKYGKIELSPSVKIDRLAHIYTDRALAPDWVERLERVGTPFTLCE